MRDAPRADDCRTVVFTTGIRAEYDILYPVIKAVHTTPGFRAKVVIAGAHLSPMYGYTVADVTRDGFECLARIETLLNSDSRAGRVKSAAIQLMGLVDVIANAQPDLLVATADREEALTVAMAGAYMAIPVVHIGGGDTTDDGIDNSVRHAVTKLSHLHMVTTARSAERVRQLGEEDWRIHVVGAPGLDRLLSARAVPREELSRHLQFDVSQRPLALVIQHSVIAQIGDAARQMRETLSALTSAGIRTLVGYPNSDAGSQQVIAVIEEFAREHPGLLACYRNLPREMFAGLMRIIDVLVGNSSCGIIEAPLLRIPVVNIGSRQGGREHSDNVIFAPHDAGAIRDAVHQALFNPAFRKGLAEATNPYGDGHTGERIAAILAATPLDERLLQKKSTY